MLMRRLFGITLHGRIVRYEIGELMHCVYRRIAIVYLEGQIHFAGQKTYDAGAVIVYGVFQNVLFVFDKDIFLFGSFF